MRRIGNAAILLITLSHRNEQYSNFQLGFLRKLRSHVLIHTQLNATIPIFYIWLYNNNTKNVIFEKHVPNRFQIKFTLSQKLIFSVQIKNTNTGKQWK